MSKTPSAILNNSKIYGKKAFLPENSVSTALSHIWTDSLTEFENYKNLYELYKSKYDSVLNNNAKLQNELQKYFNLGLVTPENTRPVSVSTADTIISDMDEPLKQLLQYLTLEHLPKSTTSTPYSTLYHEINDSKLARALNCDLALNHLTTLDTPSKIWSNLNNRCIEKFGGQNCIKNNTMYHFKYNMGQNNIVRLPQLEHDVKLL
ncbi:uncharacterized protein OCT59_010461 [Rhizophagus irregularis]|uniref:uncharacterized protein n=1 Tax=Rhizophagus irregularis TaxID=588596 RepID=UPI000CAEAAEF|nr:hypothetical protein OCT59_010461 [Rhizophagus irregularis]GBC29986.1 hypothetical protein GLOIN_2v1840268 [Rhizophagus irregularis DAOM 181602=DAOM 197198]